VTFNLGRELAPEKSHLQFPAIAWAESELHIIHLSSRLLVLSKAGHRGEIILILAFRTSLIGGILIGVLLDIF
jgi:hypothetical protein